ncbi:MAG: hypothetical protein WA865_14190, partial [Spirulinaceae cyanobacterium]
ALPTPVPPFPRGARGDTPLLANNELITLPSASSLAALRQQVKDRPLAPKKLAVLADPVYAIEGLEAGQVNQKGGTIRDVAK